MAPSDAREPFMHIPWAARLLNKPGTVTRIAGSRKPKASTEDSLFAEVLKTDRTIRSCLSFHPRPEPEDAAITEIHTLMIVGNGMNGHPAIMHGGIVASIIDEAMGILQTANHERNHLLAVGKGLAQGELPEHGIGSFTAELKIKYLKPVQTPGALIVTARYTKKEGRKEWIYAEIRQRHGAEEDYDGDEVVCATGEALFIEPKQSRL